MKTHSHHEIITVGPCAIY